ncbi:beta-ketoacyl synthase N-terminal-like domain-containing protein [Actinophytocola algeriensis]|uniref:3-oxoacyl-[acyl-carrier-protein] synthase II n=1 Tax=Actinophytocola algeriensis TaxID=1768010 RepID=A0A7W7VJG2_9PSEU|nr:beta-ketoacyl synthase N-terminal-like domain-containing protein [Actinophytocola algeriensis]MBB4912045.1 3-oxoacyl-[acyl-carrier-protein] synthase II [Actinophytocola algeriensis]MBE1477463.1 3-oxoacyl-[acyl-carrier-protein] synthase II [Actinophytocola algeriensis]
MTGVLITAWSALTPFGHGRAAFADGVLRGVPAKPVSTKDDWAEADARVVPDFDIVEQLGRKGTSSMDRTSALAIATLRELVADAGGAVEIDARTGVVLGTTSGSNRTQFEFTRDSLTRRKPYLVNPAQMPFALMNSAAAQCAMWHGLTGPNSTVAAGRNAGPSVLRYASRLLRTGRASGVFAGAVEEHSGARELLEPGGVLGEASVLLFMQTGEPGNRPALAEVVALDTRLGEPRRALAGCLEHVLSGLAVDEVWGIASTAADPELSEVEREATGEVLGPRVETVVRPGLLVGDTGAASGVLGVAALLAAAEADTAARGRLAVATSVDRDGTAGAVVLRLTGSPHELRGEG